MTGVSVGDLAVRFGCELRGDPDVLVETVATLANAHAHALSFLANPSYRHQLAGTAAGAVVVAEPDADAVPGVAIVASDPYLTYARMAALLHPPVAVRPGVGAGAVIDPAAEIDDSAEIGANAVIGPGTHVGAHAVIGAGTVVGRDCRIGEATRLAPNVTIMDAVTMGARCVVHAGAVIGSDGFGIARGPAGWERVPQVGGVVIGDDVDIGASTTIDRGAIEPTRIGNGVKLDNQIQIGHNTVIGDHTVMAGMVGIAGSTTIGANCAFGGNSGTVGHVRLADGVIITARCTVTSDIDTPGTYGGVFPHDDIRNHQRSVARFRQLDKLARRLTAIEKRLKQQENTE